MQQRYPEILVGKIFGSRSLKNEVRELTLSQNWFVLI
jgi:hypothetical protein